MNRYLNYKNYIIGSYFVPLFSGLSIRIIITGHTTLSTYNVDVVGVQARLIGLLVLIFSLGNIYYVLIEIPKSFGKGKAKEVLNIFFRSPFFITWNTSILISIFGDSLKKPELINLGLLIICFLFQLLLNRKIVKIYLR